MPELTAELKGSVEIKEIQRILEEANVVIKVGYPAGRTHIDAVHVKQKDGSYKGHAEGGKETAELARELYFGTSRTPARPFLTDAIYENKVHLRGLIKEQVERIKDGMSPNWNRVGSEAVKAIQTFVRGDYYKTNIPNSELTIEKKGSDIPLIDSADLINSTAYQVER